MRIIAEIGSNWKTKDDCIKSIGAAKVAGADAVKFQTFTGRELYGPLYCGEAHLLPDIEVLSVEAALVGIEFMCTAFSPEGYRFVDHYVETHKIASSELTDENILKTVNELRKPVLLSTGGANYHEIDRARQLLKDCSVTLMFCVAEYPAKVIDFRHLADMQSHYGLMAHYGYSDHSIDVLNIPLIAKRHGCEVLEKHVNFCGYTDTPDAPHSLSGEEFSQMVRHLREDLSLKETKRSNPHKRKSVTLANGITGYYRPHGI